MSETKKCSKCGKIKSVSEFYVDKRMRDGHINQCRECKMKQEMIWAKSHPGKMRASARKYRRNNLEKIRERERRFYLNNPKKMKEKSAKYRLGNHEKIIKYQRKWYLIPRNKLSNAVSTGIYDSLRGNKNCKHWWNLVGYTLQDLTKHLEKQFVAGMSWDNYGKWHIDHVKPISSFSFNSYEDENFKRCWSLKNLQPLWAYDNMSKGCRA